MRPITFVNGIIFACSTVMTLVLGGMLLMRMALLSDQSVNPAELAGQLPAAELVRYALTVAVVAFCAAWALAGQLFLKPWRWRAQAAQLAAIVGAMGYLLASPGQRGLVLEGVALVVGVVAIGQVSGLFRRVWDWINADQV